ncbi:hypothetical protein AB0M44_38720 [Streptosporangium subroseum]|uniref:hypothetical protein n=1 Tax=Streptosporangium subroseum TaxID=106412 RepID=UPI0034235FF6
MHSGEVVVIMGPSGSRDEYPARLSGGQKQRAAIAREIAERVAFMDAGYIPESISKGPVRQP